MQLLHSPEQAANWLHTRVTGELCSDSRKLQDGDGFVAWPGAATDARAHVGAALAQGAAACLVEQDGVAPFAFADERVAAYARLRAATGEIAAHFYAHPSHAMDLLAVTGTNGKTSTSWWLAQALAALQGEGGRGCGLIGTLGVGVVAPAATGPDTLLGLQPTGLTTPDPVLLQRQLRSFADQGIRFCALEASSIGLAEHRLDGTRVRVALFTNFTQDHLDYHGSMEAYWQAKLALFSWPGVRCAVVNVDDPRGAELAQMLQGRGLDVWTLSMQRSARLRAVDLAYGAQGMQFTVLEGQQRHSVQTCLIGGYNVANLLGVIAALRCLEIPLQQAVQACASLTPVPGRMDCLTAQGQPLVVVDYAHTPDALDKALLALQPLARERGGRLWCVFGCGGDRDQLKRPLMAAVAQKNADRVVVTSDNPRGERPEAIVSQVLLGLSHSDSVEVQVDRAQAIAQTLAQAAAADVVLIAGKGHESTQEVAGVKHAFSDKAQAQAALASRGSPWTA